MMYLFVFKPKKRGKEIMIFDEDQISAESNLKKQLGSLFMLSDFTCIKYPINKGRYFVV